jgi:hypothetical protein
MFPILGEVGKLLEEGMTDFVLLVFFYQQAGYTKSSVINEGMPVISTTNSLQAEKKRLQ